MPKKAIPSAILAFFKRLFRARNIIVVSAHKVDHIPLSGGMQFVLVAVVVSCVSVLSYFAGNYAAARSLVAEKERKLQATEMEKSLMDKDFALLKRDLVKVKTNGKELSEYSKFILDQYASESKKNPNGAPAGASMAAKDQFKQSAAAGGDKLFDRIQYLEKRINEITSENAQLLYAIRSRTEGKIDLFEDIISATGLNKRTLDHALVTPPDAAPARVSSGKPADFSGQGGPFIPYDPALFNKDNKALLGDIDRLVRLQRIVNVLPIGLPMREYQERSGFGSRTDPFTGEAAFHPGLDFAGPVGAKVYAANDGVVTAAEREGSYGNMIDIDHGLDLSTRYAHLSKILVQEGDRVKKGQLIGIQGTTGRSTGPHLHYEVRFHDQPIDPSKFLTARNLYVSQIQ